MFECLPWKFKFKLNKRLKGFWVYLKNEPTYVGIDQVTVDTDQDLVLI